MISDFFRNYEYTMSINVLLIGSGGREHTLAWGIAKSPLLKKLYTAPGNPGTESLGENVNLDVSDHAAVLDFVRSNDIDLTVIGPEQPLVEGIADVLENAGHKVFGPKQQAAMLEGSKEFAKDFMARNAIPTAAEWHPRSPKWHPTPPDSSEMARCHADASCTATFQGWCHTLKQTANVLIIRT